MDEFPSLNDLQKEAAELRESQELFELYVSDYVSLARCRVSTLPWIWSMPTLRAVSCSCT